MIDFFKFFFCYLLKIKKNIYNVSADNVRVRSARLLYKAEFVDTLFIFVY